MNAAWAFAASFTEAIARDGWPGRLHGKTVPAAETALSDEQALALSKSGFLVVGGGARFMGVSSCHRPAPGDQAANLLTRLDCLLCASVFVRYLSILVRDKLGGFMDEAEVGVWLGQWLGNFVLPNPEQTDASVQVRRPLRAAEVEIHKLPGDPPRHRLVIRLQPYYQLDPPPAAVWLPLEAMVPVRS
jgi:predicted component of type VI protein secretion system